MKLSTIIWLSTAAWVLAWCATYDPSIRTQQDITHEAVSWLLSKTDITINNLPHTLELWETDTQYAINDSDCSVDPTSSHMDNIPETYYDDSVIACLYPQEEGFIPEDADI